MGMNPIPRQRLADLYQFIQSNPGNTQRRIERMLGMCKDGLNSTLATMEVQGFLLSEDLQGGLHPYRILDR